MNIDLANTRLAAVFRRNLFLRQSVYAFELLLERRFWLFVIVDLVIVTQGLLGALLGSGELEEIYRSMAIMPMLLLGVPVLSSTVALERRAGSLDLALAVPSTERYFLRRVVPVCALFIVQAWILTFVSYLTVLEGRFFQHMLSSKGFFVLPVLLHAALVGLFIGAATLFWAARISTTGGAMVASFATLFALSKWILASPILEGLGPSSAWLLGVIPRVLLSLTWNLGVLALTTVLFYLYARERLRRPELMLA